MTTTEAKLTPHAGILLLKLGRLAQRQCAAELKAEELTPRHFATLIELRAGPRSQQSLGEAVGADPSKLVGILNDLEAEGLVVRRRDPDDRRRHIVELAPKGETRLEATECVVDAIEERMLASLTDEQREQLAHLLSIVADTSGLPDAFADEPISG